MHPTVSQAYRNGSLWDTCGDKNGALEPLGALELTLLSPRGSQGVSSEAFFHPQETMGDDFGMLLVTFLIVFGMLYGDLYSMFGGCLLSVEELNYSRLWARVHYIFPECLLSVGELNGLGGSRAQPFI